MHTNEAIWIYLQPNTNAADTSGASAAYPERASADVQQNMIGFAPARPSSTSAPRLYTARAPMHTRQKTFLQIL